MAKRKSDVGTLYKGSPGQWSWLLHRITGVAVILFLFAPTRATGARGSAFRSCPRGPASSGAAPPSIAPRPAPRGIEVTKAIQDVKRTILFDRF